MESSDVNNDGSDDLIMGAPVYSKLNTLQNGAVFIQLANKETGKLPFQTINLEQSADYIMQPPNDTVSSRFGHSLTMLDLNQDGFNDLVVSAPSYGLQSLTYQV
jgi:glycosylphosphatidylinositol phospholipase D